MANETSKTTSPSNAPPTPQQISLAQIQTCWKYPDHSFLDLITGAPLMQAPTNTQFIDMLAAYLRN